MFDLVQESDGENDVSVGCDFVVEELVFLCGIGSRPVAPQKDGLVFFLFVR